MGQASGLAPQVVPATRGHSFLRPASPVHAEQPPETSTQHFFPSLPCGMFVATGACAAVKGGLCKQVFSVPALVSPSMNQDTLQRYRLQLPAVAPATITEVVPALVMMEKFKGEAWRAVS